MAAAHFPAIAAPVAIAVVISATAAVFPATVVAHSVVVIAAVTAALHPASAGNPLLHEKHSVVEEGPPPFVPLSPPAVIHQDFWGSGQICLA